MDEQEYMVIEITSAKSNGAMAKSSMLPVWRERERFEGIKARRDVEHTTTSGRFDHKPGVSHASQGVQEGFGGLSFTTT